MKAVDHRYRFKEYLVELRHLQHFIAIAEESSFSRAATRLNLVQSALSVSIRNLEKDVAAELFFRTNRGVRLTRAGEALLPAARQVLRDVAVARDEVDAVRGAVRGRLQIGMMQSLGLINAARLFATFHQVHPGVVIEPRPAPGGALTLAEQVHKGELDMAFLWHPHATAYALDIVELATEPLMLVAPAGRGGLPDGEVNPHDLRKEAFIDFPQGWGARALVDQAFRDAGVPRRTEIETADVPLCIELVRAGFGVSIVPRSQISRPDGLTSRPIAGLSRWGVSLAVPSAGRRTAAAASFTRLVCAEFDVTLTAARTSRQTSQRDPAHGTGWSDDETGLSGSRDCGV